MTPLFLCCGVSARAPCSPENHNIPGSCNVQADLPSTSLRAHSNEEDTANRILQYLKHGNSRMRTMAAFSLGQSMRKSTAHSSSKGQHATDSMFSVLATTDIYGTLTGLLTEGNEQGIQHAAAAIGTLISKDAEGGAAQALSSGVLEALIHAAQTANSSGARKETLRTLSKLLRHEPARNRLVACEGHKILVELLHKEDSGTIRSALLCVYYAGADRPHIQELLASWNLVPVLLRLCHWKDARIVQHAAQVLKMLTKSRVCCEAICAAEGYATLVSLAKNSRDQEASVAAKIALERIELVRRMAADLIPSGPSTTPRRVPAADTQAVGQALLPLEAQLLGRQVAAAANDADGADATSPDSGRHASPEHAAEGLGGVSSNAPHTAWDAGARPESSTLSGAFPQKGALQSAASVPPGCTTPPKPESEARASGCSATTTATTCSPMHVNRLRSCSSRVSGSAHASQPVEGAASKPLDTHLSSHPHEPQSPHTHHASDLGGGRPVLGSPGGESTDGMGTPSLPMPPPHALRHSINTTGGKRVATTLRFTSHPLDDDSIAVTSFSGTAVSAAASSTVQGGAGMGSAAPSGLRASSQGSVLGSGMRSTARRPVAGTPRQLLTCSVEVDGPVHGWAQDVATVEAARTSSPMPMASGSKAAQHSTSMAGAGTHQWPSPGRHPPLSICVSKCSSGRGPLTQRAMSTSHQAEQPSKLTASGGFGSGQLHEHDEGEGSTAEGMGQTSPCSSDLDTVGSSGRAVAGTARPRGFMAWPPGLDLGGSVVLGSPTSGTPMTAREAAAAASCQSGSKLGTGLYVGAEVVSLRLAAAEEGLEEEELDQETEEVEEEQPAAHQEHQEQEWQARQCSGIEEASSSNRPETSALQAAASLPSVFTCSTAHSQSFSIMRPFHSMPPLHPHHPKHPQHHQHHLMDELMHAAAHAAMQEGDAGDGPHSPMSSVASAQVVRRLLDSSNSAESSAMASARSHSTVGGSLWGSSMGGSFGRRGLAAISAATAVAAALPSSRIGSYIPMASVTAARAAPSTSAAPQHTRVAAAAAAAVQRLVPANSSAAAAASAAVSRAQSPAGAAIRATAASAASSPSGSSAAPTGSGIPRHAPAASRPSMLSRGVPAQVAPFRVTNLRGASSGLPRPSSPASSSDASSSVPASGERIGTAAATRAAGPSRLISNAASARAAVASQWANGTGTPTSSVMPSANKGRDSGEDSAQSSAPAQKRLPLRTPPPVVNMRVLPAHRGKVSRVTGTTTATPLTPTSLAAERDTAATSTSGCSNITPTNSERGRSGASYMRLTAAAAAKAKAGTAVTVDTHAAVPSRSVSLGDGGSAMLRALGKPSSCAAGPHSSAFSVAREAAAATAVGQPVPLNPSSAAAFPVHSHRQAAQRTMGVRTPSGSRWNSPSTQPSAPSAPAARAAACARPARSRTPPSIPSNLNHAPTAASMTAIPLAPAAAPAGSGGPTSRQPQRMLPADSARGLAGVPAGDGVPTLQPPCASPVRDSVDSLDGMLMVASGKLGGFLLTPEQVTVSTDPQGRKITLGEGGFGLVYKGVMNGVDEVAVKVARKEVPSRRELEAFLGEVSLLARLHHRNIVQAYGVCLTGQLCLVTELLRGGDLYHALRNHPALMRWDCLGRKVALDIALGINHLHCQTPPLMHRDLKSPNVLLSEEGVAKVADVGMSRAQVSETVSAQPIMTPLWAAPEVVAKQPASIKCDVWSYGVLIWELATGADITEFTPLSVSRQMGLTGPKTVAMPADAPEIAVRIFDRCTQLDPADRPSVAQIVAWLRDVDSHGGAVGGAGSGSSSAGVAPMG